MYWLYLALGIIFEVLGTICMKKAEGFYKLGPSVLVFVFGRPCFGARKGTGSKRSICNLGQCRNCYHCHYWDNLV